VEGGGGSEILEWNGVQWIDAIEKKYPDGGDITGDIGDTFKEFEAGPLALGGNLLPNECARDIESEPRLGDSSVGPFLGEQVQILDAAVQDIYGVDHA
jgi:hypothetical protein